MSKTLPRPRCQLQLEALENRVVPTADMVLQWNETLRETVRSEYEIAFDAHAKIFEPTQAMQLGNALAPYDPLFFEEPIRPENIEAWGDLRRGLKCTLATGESLYSRFEFLRPDRFRFVYAKPFEQTIVADGQRLWLHDVDLNQVTVRAQKDALGSTPAALIASGGDLSSLRSAFDFKALPDKDGLEWVEAVPKARDGQLQRVRVGLRAKQLAVLDIEDGLGQRSELTFKGWQANPGLATGDFRFATASRFALPTPCSALIEP